MNESLSSYLDNFGEQFFVANGRYPTVETYQLVSILLGLLFHTFCFVTIVPLASSFFKTYQDINTMEKIEWRMRAVSSIHAVVSFTMAFYCLFIDDVFYSFTLVRSSYPTDVTLCFSAGYFIFDLVSALDTFH